MENENIPNKKSSSALFWVISSAFILVIAYTGMKFVSDDQVPILNDPHRTKLPTAPVDDIYDVSQLEIDMAASKTRREEESKRRELELQEKIEKEKKIEKMRVDSVKKAVRDSIRKAKTQPKTPTDSL